MKRIHAIIIAFFLNYKQNVIQCENFPFVVRIVTGISSTASHENMCSGSLFLQNWVLTSAFCIHGILPNQIEIFAGNSPGKLFRKVKAVFMHDQYNKSTHEYNIALLKLTKPFSQTQPIPVAIFVKEKLLKQQFFELNDTYDNAIFLGWLGDSMDQRRIRIIPQKLVKDGCLENTLNQFLCSVPKKSNLVPQRGDWGGPLTLMVNYLGTQQYLQFGILSTTVQHVVEEGVDLFDDSGLPQVIQYNVYTYLYYHFDWLRYTIKNNTNDNEIEQTFNAIPNEDSGTLNVREEIVSEFRRNAQDFKKHRRDFSRLEKDFSIELPGKSPYNKEDEEYDFDETEFHEALDHQ